MTNQRHLTLLKHDVKAWNYWRQENSDLKLDLSGANLSELNLSGVNLSRVNLSRANLSETNLKCAYLKGANFYQACLTTANLSGSDLSEVNLTQANLTQADISSANLKNANLTKAKALLTNFQNSILTGACLEDWHIDSNTNLEALVCDYFYGKQGKQQRYPQHKLQNFAPGECTQFIIDYSNQINALVIANNNKPNHNSQEKVYEDKNIIDEVEVDEGAMGDAGSRRRSQREDAGSELGSDPLAVRGEETSPHASSISEPRSAVARRRTFDHIDNNWDEEPEKIKLDSAIPIISPTDRSQKKNSIIRLSVALLFGLIVTGIAMGQLFKRTLIADNNLINCDSTLLKQAEDAIFIRDEEALKQVMQQLEEFDSPLGNLVDEQCKQTLYEVKYIYAIHIKATRDHNLFEAVELLCQLPEQYYQQHKSKPWFLRWSNSFAHTDFPQQLSEYIKANDCPAADYLNQHPLID